MTARKPIMALEAEAEEPEMQALTAHDGVPLKRSLSAVNLVSLGIGAIIGAGIFVLTGHAAAANAGPAITLSFVLGAFRATATCRNRRWGPPLSVNLDGAAPQRGDLVFWSGHVAIVRDRSSLLHANAFHMSVAIEPIAEAVSRIRDSGSEISSVRRIETPID
jgi:hypothetical protein